LKWHYSTQPAAEQAATVANALQVIAAAAIDIRDDQTRREVEAALERAREALHKNDPPPPWHQDQKEVFLFAERLEQAAAFVETSEVVQYFRTPSAWDACYRRWCMAGRPAVDESSEEEDIWDEILEGAPTS